MLTGIRLQAHPTEKQKLILNQWMGCARFVWNAKCQEEKYYSRFARKYHPIGTYAPIDQTSSQFKDEEFTPFLSDCPSQILRNSVSNWYSTYQKFIKGVCGKPKYKKKTSYSSIHLTKELFDFQVGNDGVTRLFIGSKRNNIGFLSLKVHKNFNLPNSIYIINDCGRYYVSFCYETEKTERKGKTKFRTKENEKNVSDKEMLDILSMADEKWLNENTIGIDRGIAIPVHTGSKTYDYDEKTKAKQLRSAKYIKRHHKRLSRQVKESKKREKTKRKLNNEYRKMKNRRKDFCHKTSLDIVNSAKVFIFEDLNIKNMTKKAKPKKDENGKFIKNNKKAKSGLNRSILNVGWGMFQSFVKYKSLRQGKACFKVHAAHTSQECSHCEYIHPDNRKSQDVFHCISCGYEDNADANASRVIKKRAIKLIHSGAELTKKGVLSSQSGGANQFHIRPNEKNFKLGNGSAVKKEGRSFTGSHPL